MVQTGPAGTLPQAYVNALNGTNWQGQTLAGNGTETQLNRYNQAGQMMEQIVFKSDGTPNYKVSYEPAAPLLGSFYPGLGYVRPGTGATSGYDAAGNLVGYTITNFEDGTTSHYNIVSERAEGYRQARIDGTGSKTRPGTTVFTYDANSHLVAVGDTTNANNNRSYVNDLSGTALFIGSWREAKHV